jgi:hypothetical protein
MGWISTLDKSLNERVAAARDQSIRPSPGLNLIAGDHAC